MKKIIENIIITGLLIVLAYVGTNLVLNLTKIEFDNASQSIFSKGEQPVYRVMVIVDGSDVDYVDQLRVGIEEATRSHRVAYELWDFDGDNKNDAIIDQFEIGVYSNVDGIVIQALEDDRFDHVLEEANTKEIPVVTIETAIPKAERVSFITYNRYQIGTTIGKKLQTYYFNNNTYTGTVVMLNQNNTDLKDQAVGIKEGLGIYYDLEIRSLDDGGRHLINAEELTLEVLSEYDDLVGIICNSSDESIGVIQALKEANALDRVEVVAFGNEDTILDYIDRDIIFATVVPDVHQLGVDVIENLVQYKNGGFVSTYQTINIDILTKENVEMHLEVEDE